VTITARIFRPIRPDADKRTVERGERSQAKREKKLIPYDQKLFDSIPGKSKKMFDARNVPREGCHPLLGLFWASTDLQSHVKFFGVSWTVANAFFLVVLFYVPIVARPVAVVDQLCWCACCLKQVIS
jgi:Flp pilus assembly protein TadB